MLHMGNNNRQKCYYICIFGIADILMHEQARDSQWESIAAEAWKWFTKVVKSLKICLKIYTSCCRPDCTHNYKHCSLCKQKGNIRDLKSLDISFPTDIKGNVFKSKTLYWKDYHILKTRSLSPQVFLKIKKII